MGVFHNFAYDVAIGDICISPKWFWAINATTFYSVMQSWDSPNTTGMERSSGRLPNSSLYTFKRGCNVPSGDQGSHTDDISVSVVSVD